MACRTHGTVSKACRAAARLIVKKLPASCGATFARSVGMLLCVTSPCTVMPAMANAGWRTAHHAPDSANNAKPSANSAVAAMFISFTSSGAGMAAFIS